MKKIFIACVAFAFIQCNTPEPTTTTTGTDTTTGTGTEITPGTGTDTSMNMTDTSGVQDTTSPQQ